MAGSGRVGSGQVDGNSDNRANSAKFQVKLPSGAELGNIQIMLVVVLFSHFWPQNIAEF